MRFRALMVTLVIGAPLSACGDIDKPQATQQEVGLSCFERSRSAAPLFLNDEISVAYKGSEARDIIHDLQSNYGLPISYIDQPDGKPLDLSGEKITVSSLLHALLAKYPGNTCRIVEKHVIIYPNRSELRKIVRGVDIVNRPRGMAARAYIDIAKKQVGYFRDVDVLLGGIVEMPLFEGQVSLSPDATVVGHLAQILGRDKDAFFVIRRAPPKGFLFSLGSV